MTNPTGTTFISYRRKQADIAEALVTSLHEHGIPTWRDVSDLRTEPTQQELKRVLDDPTLAGGVVVVSEDVADSEIILELELPALHDRWQAEDGFFVVVALCPGIGYDDAADILSASPTLFDFVDWNMIKLDSTGKSPEDADEVATSILKERVRLVHDHLPADQPLSCSLDTYNSPSYRSQPAATIDWSPYFSDSLPSPTIWSQRLLPTLREVIDVVEQSAPGRSLHFRGQVHLPAAFALGRCLRSTRDVEAAWLQSPPTGDRELWNLRADEEDSPLEGDLHVNDVTGSDLALLVSISNDVEPAVGSTKPSLPDFNGVLELTLGDDIGSQLNASEAAHAADVFRRMVQEALSELSSTSKLHLFIAGPAGLAFLFGQQSNTFPPIQTYLLETSQGERTYRPAALFR